MLPLIFPLKGSGVSGITLVLEGLRCRIVAKVLRASPAVRVRGSVAHVGTASPLLCGTVVARRPVAVTLIIGLSGVLFVVYYCCGTLTVYFMVFCDFLHLRRGDTFLAFPLCGSFLQHPVIIFQPSFRQRSGLRLTDFYICVDQALHSCVCRLGCLEIRRGVWPVLRVVLASVHCSLLCCIHCL